MNTSFGPEAGAWTVALLGAGVGSMFSGATTLVDGNRARRNDVEAPGSSGNPGGSGNSDKDVHINAIPLFAEALLGAVVIATAVAGSAQPTGSDLLDPMYRGLFACLVLVGFRLSTHRVRIAFVGLLAAACLVASWPWCAPRMWLANTRMFADTLPATTRSARSCHSLNRTGSSTK